MSGDAETTSTRDRVLAAIRTATPPPTVDEIATSLRLHANSVRLHAAALKSAGLIVQDSRPGSGRGRPQVTYHTSTRGARSGGRDYQLLASLLISELEGDDGDRSAAARRIGRAWGRRIMAENAETSAGSPGATTRDRVVAALDKVGFEPISSVTGNDGTAGNTGSDADVDEIELRNCPFLELVDPHDGVVCALHSGMLDELAGTYAGADADAEHDGSRSSVTLMPFTSPQACTVRLPAG